MFFFAHNDPPFRLDSPPPTDVGTYTCTCGERYSLSRHRVGISTHRFPPKRKFHASLSHCCIDLRVRPLKSRGALDALQLGLRERHNHSPRTTVGNAACLAWQERTALAMSDSSPSMRAFSHNGDVSHYGRSIMERASSVPAQVLRDFGHRLAEGLKSRCEVPILRHLDRMRHHDAVQPHVERRRGPHDVHLRH